MFYLAMVVPKIPDFSAPHAYYAKARVANVVNRGTPRSEIRTRSFGSRPASCQRRLEADQNPGAESSGWGAPSYKVRFGLVCGSGCFERQLERALSLLSSVATTESNLSLGHRYPEQVFAHHCHQAPLIVNSRANSHSSFYKACNLPH